MIRIAVALLLTASLRIPVAAREPFPYGLVVQLDSAENVGRDELRDEAARLLVWELENEDCYRRVLRIEDRRGALEPELRLRVTLLEVVEETSWDLSLAQRSNPDQVEGGVHNSQVARMSVRVRMSLTTGEGAEIRSKTTRISRALRPRLQEDPRIEVRQVALEEAVRSVRLWVCKGTPARLEREIGKARGAAASAPAGD